MGLVIGLVQARAVHKGLESNLIDRIRICHSEDTLWFLPASAALAGVEPPVVADLDPGQLLGKCLVWVLKALFNDWRLAQ